MHPVFQSGVLSSYTFTFNSLPKLPVWLFFFFFVVLGLNLAYTLSHSTSPIFVMGFIESAQADFKP
jgi:hypothetical protein